MKLKVYSISMLSLLSLCIGGVALASFANRNVEEVEAYTASSVPTTIDLNATSDSAIRDYYSDLSSLSSSERTGNNLLKNLKPILMNGQKYYSYDSGSSIWKMYEITDRDWDKSPASAISGYNANTNIITGYKYGSSISNPGTNPYVHALYNNRNVTNQAKAWDSHGDRDNAWTIEREHVWPKSQGFEATGQGGARGDPMHLMAAEGSANGLHSAHPYGYVDKTKKYTDVGSTHSNATGNLTGKSKTKGGTATVFEPQDSDKGDIARAIFYMAARYNYLGGNDTIDTNNPNLELVDYASELSSYTSSTSNTGKMGIVSDLLEWNRLDPPDEYEIHRNDLLYTNFTNNRNPFIDFPDWADYIWGDKKNVSFANPTSDTIHNFADNSGQQQNVPVTGISLLSSTTIKVGETIVLTPEITPNNATNKNVTWNNSNDSAVSVSGGRVTGLAVGVSTVTAVSQDGQFEAPCEVTVVAEEQSQSGDSLTDTLTALMIGVTTYQDWTDLTDNSGVVYAGQTTKSSSAAIQMRTTNNNSGIVTTDSTGIIKKVSVTWNSESASGRTLNIYGKNTPYTSAADLYSDETCGTKIGTIVNGTSTSLTINDEYKYIGVRSNANALYLDNITFEWDVPVTGVALDSSSIQLDLAGDSSATLTATVLPENALNKGVSWSTSNDQVVTVENGVITAVAKGEATITVTTDSGNKTATCAVSVIDTTPVLTNDMTVTTSILELATANNWANGVAFGTSEATAVAIDENVSFYTTGTGNNGKYYSGGNNWRIYRNDSGNIIFKANNGYIIKSVALTFTNADKGILQDSGSNRLVSGETYNVNASTVQYTVSGEGAEKGQIRITNISVTYGVEGQVQTKTLSSISVNDQTTSFEKGDTFRFGGVVTATYSDDSTRDVTEFASFSGYNMQTTGNQTVTVSYTEEGNTKTASYQITITEPQQMVTLTGISVTTQPTKVVYEIGEKLNTAGMVVTATYSDGTTAPVTEYTLNNPDMSTTGSKTITVTYQSLTATFTVTVVKTLVSISVSGQTTTFTKGDAFAFGGTVTATYTDGSTKDVTSSATFSGYDMQLAEPQTVTVSYTEGGVTKTTTYEITVNEPQVIPPSPVVTLTSISVTAQPNKTEYEINENLDTTGLIVTATYSDGTTTPVTGYTLSEPDMSTAGSKTITVTYQGQTARFVVTVNEPQVVPPEPTVTLSSITVTTMPNKTVFEVGDEFVTTGIVITATYSDNSTKNVTGSASFAGYNMSEAGTQTVTVTYVEDGVTQTTTYRITVNEPQVVPPEPAVTLSSIAITSQPRKTEFVIGDILDTTGLVVTATYSDGTTKDVTSSVLFSGYNMQTAGTQTVTISYTEDSVTKTTSYQITVNNPQPVATVSSIAITSQPTKISYVTGEDLDTTGMVVTATYSDGTIRIVTDYTVSGYDKTVVGTQTITVTYQGKTATFTVTVADSLQEQKEAAIQELNNYYNSFNLSNYSLENISNLLAELKAGEEAIRSATSVEGINAALANAKARLAAIPQKEASSGSSNACGGNIAATSVILSAIALTGAALLIYKKKKLNRYNFLNRTQK